MLLADVVVASCASAGCGPAHLSSSGAPWSGMQPQRESVAVALARWNTLLRYWVEAVGDGLSNMDKDAELQSASAYQRLAPRMRAPSAK